MIVYKACPRCRGDVLEHYPGVSDRALCINCGWRQPEIPTDVIDQVEAHLGRQHIEDAYRRNGAAKKTG